MGFRLNAVARACTFLCIALACSGASAQDAASTAASRPDTGPAMISPEARAVLDRMSAYLKGLQRFSISAQETRDEVLAFGYRVQRQQTASMVVQRPARMRVDVDGDVKTRAYIYDGATLTIHAPDRGVYAQVKAPDNLGRLIAGLHNRGVEMPLIDVLSEAVKGTLTDGVQVGKLVGESKVDGVAVDHLAFRQASIDWQLWVQQGDQPVPRKLLITSRYEFGEPQYAAVLTWNLSPAIAPGTFAFKPPADARRISFLGDGDATGGQP